MGPRGMRVHGVRQCDGQGQMLGRGHSTALCSRIQNPWRGILNGGDASSKRMRAEAQQSGVYRDSGTVRVGRTSRPWYWGPNNRHWGPRICKLLAQGSLLTPSRGGVGLGHQLVVGSFFSLSLSPPPCIASRRAKDPKA